MTVALDSTYAAGVLFDASAHGVDVSMQALTRYVGGHSDLLLGTVSVGTEAALERIGATHRLLGMAVSPDDCALALRGLETLAVRLDRLGGTALEVARWLKGRPEVEWVLHPAFADCPGHQQWRRDFTGSASVFSIVFTPDWDAERVTRFAEALRLFRLGFSWGGTHSLAMVYPRLPRAPRLRRPPHPPQHRPRGALRPDGRSAASLRHRGAARWPIGTGCCKGAHGAAAPSIARGGVKRRPGHVGWRRESSLLARPRGIEPLFSP